MRVLIVEDEVRLADALRQIMLERKYIVDVVYNGADGLDYALNGEYDVMVLDIMLPKRSGFEVIREMRKNKKATPVIMLTARDEISDKIDGLDCGADDYMTKPFSTDELLARVRALSRRQSTVIFEELSFADLMLNLSTNTLSCNTKSIQLRFKEFEVLRLLMANQKAITSKEELIVKIWGSESDAEDNNVEAYISFLRKKLAYLKSRAGIETIRKIGYRLSEEAS